MMKPQCRAVLLPWTHALRKPLYGFYSALSLPVQKSYQIHSKTARNSPFSLHSTPPPPSPSNYKSFHTGCGLHSVRRGKLTGLEDAKTFVAALPLPEREALEKALNEMRKPEDGDSTVEVPSSLQLRLLCYQSSLPFIGFGFLDNVIMISVGEYLDWTVGVALGISTMAAAGIGNMISDVAGLGLADQVEALCRKLGIPDPRLSSAQMKHRSTRWTTLLGRCIGIAIGCVIGMAPLYWIQDPHKQHPPLEETQRTN